MLRRTAFLALTSLALSGCVTYEVVERRVYREDGSYTRVYDPYDDGRRYEERGYDGYERYDDRYDREGRVRRYEYDAPRYGGYDDDPNDRWFYGSRGYGSAWDLDPYFGYSSGSSVRIVYRHRGYRPTWYWSSWYSPSWSNRWSWSPSWYSGYRPWGGGYYGPGYGYGYNPPRPHVPRPQQPRPVEPRPMPKPAVRSVGPEVSLPIMAGPSVGGEALRPVAREQRWEEPNPRDAMSDVTPRAKPQPVFVDTPPQEGTMPRFERKPREEPPRFEEPRFEEPRFVAPRDEPRFEPREPERVFERRVEEPRFEPREEPRFEPRDEPRFERREEPRFEPREEPRFEPREEPRFEAPREEPVVEERVE
jgi:hypothetical protein